MTTVLVVEDEKAVRQTLKTIMVEQGVRVILARTVSEAVAKYHEYSPHVVTLDMKLGTESGLDAAAAIKQLDPEAYLVGITAFEQYRSEALLRGLEFQDWFYKPIASESRKKELGFKLLDLAEMRERIIASTAVESLRQVRAVSVERPRLRLSQGRIRRIADELGCLGIDGESELDIETLRAALMLSSLRVMKDLRVSVPTFMKIFFTEVGSPAKIRERLAHADIRTVADEYAADMNRIIQLVAAPAEDTDNGE